MDSFFAMEMRPRHKEDKPSYGPKKIDAHIISPEELAATFGKQKKLGGLITKIIPHGKDKQPIENKQAPEKAAAAEPLPQAEIAPSLPTEKPLVAVDGLVASKQMFSPNFKTLNTGEAKVEEELLLAAEQPQKKEVVTPEIIITHESNEEKPVEHTDVKSLTERQQHLLDELLKSVRNFNEDELRTAIENIAVFRNEDAKNLAADSELNLAIKTQLISGLCSVLAYGGSTSIGRTLQLLDTLGLEIQSSDLTLLPGEILNSPEMRSAATKYLLWCAKEYEELPLELEKKISCFAGCGIVNQAELRGQLEETIAKNILSFAKEHVKNPSEIERKIYQYSLAGFIDGASFKKNTKLVEICESFFYNWIEKHLDRVDEITKKLAQYEHCGFFRRSDLRSCEKVQKMIGKHLAHYIKLNDGHPRKITMRINEYVRGGLITNQLKEDLLRASR